ncbi:MAG TPA: tyrosine-type recombinase/integrase [Dehalococcoidia bacterium]|nr:tyrosine-type recombinase/integrase [Dehalococcoidia bacterium]
MARPRTINKHLPKYVTVIHGAYWFRPPKAKAVRLAALGDEPGMYRALADQVAAVPSGPLTTLADCFDRYEREIVPTLAPRTQKDYRRHLSILRRWCGDVRPDDLKPRDVGRFLDVDKGKIHRNKQIGVLSAVYTKMVGRWYVAERNPCVGVERNRKGKRDRYVTDAEFAAVYAVVPPRLQVAMDLALLTGQRQGDLLALQWDAVDEAGVHFRQGKTGKRLVVEISPALEAVLLRARQLVPQLPRRYVLRTRKGQRYSSEGFRAIWQRRMAKVLRSGALKERFTFHDLRAKSVSDSKTLDEAYERAGHASMSMTRGVYDRAERRVKPLR